MPALSTVATVLMLVPVAAVVLNIHRTVGGKWSSLAANPPLRFMAVGTLGFVFAWLVRIVCAGVDGKYPVGLTWLTAAQAHLNTYGFFCLVMFGAAYAILPWLTQSEFPAPRLVRAHFWMALLGVLLTVLPLAVAGIVEARRMLDPNIPFMSVAKSTLTFLRVSTMGDLLLALGHLLFLAECDRTGRPVLSPASGRGLCCGHRRSLRRRGQAMNHGPLIFLAAFFALASSWCGFVLAPQVQVGQLQQTNTLSGGATYPLARSGLAQQGLAGLSRQRLRQLPQPAGPAKRDPVRRGPERGGHE